MAANATALPEELLVAYSPGVVTLGDQARPLEVVEVGGRNGPAGGYPERTGGADEYYEDFTSGLRDYVTGLLAAGSADPGVNGPTLVGGWFGGGGADPSALVLDVDWFAPSGGGGTTAPDSDDGGAAPDSDDGGAAPDSDDGGAAPDSDEEEGGDGGSAGGGGSDTFTGGPTGFEGWYGALGPEDDWWRSPADGGAPLSTLVEGGGVSDRPPPRRRRGCWPTSCRC